MARKTTLFLVNGVFYARVRKLGKAARLKNG